MNIEDVLELGKFEKPTEKLIEIFEKIFGIFIDPAKKLVVDMTTEKRHKYELEKIDIEEKVKIGAIQFNPDLAERAKNRLDVNETKRQLNLEQIGTIALQLLPKNAVPEKINIDWLDHFIISSQDTGEQYLRNIWANILSQEATKPGRFSKRTLDYFKNFSVDDCKLFEKFLPFIFKHNDTAIFYNPFYRDFIKFRDEFDFSYLDFFHLTAIGIIIGNFAELRVDIGKHLEYYYFDKKIRIYNENNQPQIITAYMLTEVGSQLANIVDAVGYNEFLDIVISNIKSKGLRVETDKF
jgi:hypothetical protein